MCRGTVIILNLYFDIINRSIFRVKEVHPHLFVKLVFEIAVAQQTRTRDQTFEGIVDTNR